MFALLFGELHAQGFFQGGPNGLQRRQLFLLLDAEKGVAGVGREEPGHVFRVAQGCGVKALALDELKRTALPTCWAVARGWATLCCQKSCSLSARVNDSRSTGCPRRAVLDDQELAQIGHDHDAVAALGTP